MEIITAWVIILKFITADHTFSFESTVWYLSFRDLRVNKRFRIDFNFNSYISQEKVSPMKRELLSSWNFKTCLFRVLRIHACLQPAPRKGIQDSLGLWIPHRGFRIPSTGLRTPIVSGIPDSMSCIPNSKAQASGFHKQKFPLLTRCPKQRAITDCASKSTRKDSYLLIISKSFSLFLPGSIMTNNEVDFLWRISNNTPDLFKWYIHHWSVIPFQNLVTFKQYDKVSIDP